MNWQILFVIIFKIDFSSLKCVLHSFEKPLLKQRTIKVILLDPTTILLILDLNYASLTCKISEIPTIFRIFKKFKDLLKDLYLSFRNIFSVQESVFHLHVVLIYIHMTV